MSSSTQSPTPAGPSARPKAALRSRVVSGSLVLLAGSGLVSAFNLLYNIAVARMLGPAGFADAAAVNTVLMLLSAVSLSFQIVCAKLVANHDAMEEKAAIYLRLHRRSWREGLVIAGLLVLAQGPLTSYLNLSSPHLIELLAVGIAFYIPLGARRGYIQGTCAFGRLSLNFILEGAVRLGGALALVSLGAGVPGAVLASVGGVTLAYLFLPPGPEVKIVPSREVPVSFGEGLQAIVFFTGQVIINNCDIVLVKHFFLAAEAGLYAAVALVGRLVNVCAWSVVNSMFPVAAGTGAREESAKPVLRTALLLVVLILTGLVLGLWLMPSFLWRLVFGARFDLFSQGTISYLLVLYAITSGVYALSSVIIAYEMSRKLANTAWVQLIFSGVLVLCIELFHRTLEQVIWVQLILLCVLLGVVMLPFLIARAARIAPEITSEAEASGTMRKLRCVGEDEVIAEFLKNEFPHPDFDPYRDGFQDLVRTPDLSNAAENSARRSLLFLRRGAMWRELPPDTQWFDVELGPEDLNRIRVFPRAHWRKLARESFYLTDVVGYIRARAAEMGNNDSPEEFYRRLRALDTLISRKAVNTTVLLIGVDESGPLTILDGNHRLTAAMLACPATAPERFRFICGLSSSMVQCCWYRTNLVSLWHYASNLVRHMTYDAEADLGRYLQDRQRVA